uniref:Uncharacterized protein n=1 Tax=Panagrolaimus sp. ES5 TaxID=591445 RepID=A0AC34G2T9_9BILA
MEGVIILQVWRRGAITILADTCGQIISHSSSYKFDMEDDDDVVALVEKVAEIHNKHENQDFKGILVQLFLDEKDAQFDITYKFCNFCKECFGESKIPFHITTLPTFSAYTALLNSHTNISNDEKVMIVQTGEIYHSGEMKNYCLQILIKRDSNNYQFVYSTIILDEKALAAAKEMIKENYNPKKVILIQLFPKSAALHREKLTSETNPFLAAKKVLKSFHPICIPQSFATLSMEAGAKMIMNLVNGYEDQVNIFPHCRDRYAIVSSLKKKYLTKIELNEYLPLEVSVIFDLKDENDESLKLVALDQLTEKSYILAKINPADFESVKRVKAVLKLDINSLFDFYVEPAGDDDELTAYLEEEYSMEEIDLVEEPEEEESEDESVSTCTEPTTEEQEKNNAEKEKGEEKQKLIPDEDSCGESSENYDSEDIENGFDNSTIGWDDTDEIDFDVGSVTSIESFMQNDPGYKTRVIFDKQYFWILSDGNEEYEKVPIYIAFNEEKPIVGEAAKVLFETQPSFVVYDLIEICSSMNEKTSNLNWSFSLKNDSDGILSFFFESINGSTKSTPDFLVAIILKHCLRLVKQKTGEKVNELFIAFNFPNPSDELKNVFQDAAKLLPL